MGGHIMKVHKFQIEVMWLMLAMSFCGFTDNKMDVFAHQHNWIKKGIPKEPRSPIQIRPPPSGGEL
jgi:hypothetical protein